MVVCVSPLAGYCSTALALVAKVVETGGEGKTNAKKMKKKNEKRRRTALSFSRDEHGACALAIWRVSAAKVHENAWRERRGATSRVRASHMKSRYVFVGAVSHLLFFR